MRALTAVPALLALVTACEPQGASPRGAASQATTALQGTKLQGTKLQGTKLQGTKLQGTKLQGSSLSGLGVDGLEVRAGQLVAWSGGVAFEGAEVVGLTLVGALSNGAELPFRIDSAAAEPSDPSGQTFVYGVSYLDPDTGAWVPACETDLAGQALAIPIAALWDDAGARVESTSMFTLACTAGVLAKCIRWGYRPWERVGGVSLVPYHQACTRMARADYCGNGVTHTHDGTLIDIYDPLGIQIRTPNSGLLFEAAWAEGGAYCVGKERWNIVSQTLLLECPEKLARPSLSDVLAGCQMNLLPAGTTVRVRDDSNLLNVSLLGLTAKVTLK